MNSDTEDETLGDTGRRRPWAENEDALLMQILGENADPKTVKWPNICESFPGRTAKQCRERYQALMSNTLHREWTLEEDMQIINLHQLVGTKWKEYTKVLTTKSDNAVKNRWNSTLRRVQRYEQTIKKHGIGSIKPETESQPLFKYCRQILHKQDGAGVLLLENGTTSMSNQNMMPSSSSTSKRSKSAQAKLVTTSSQSNVSLNGPLAENLKASPPSHYPYSSPSTVPSSLGHTAAPSPLGTLINSHFNALPLRTSSSSPPAISTNEPSPSVLPSLNTAFAAPHSMYASLSLAQASPTNADSVLQTAPAPHLGDTPLKHTPLKRDKSLSIPGDSHSDVSLARQDPLLLTMPTHKHDVHRSHISGSVDMRVSPPEASSALPSTLTTSPTARGPQSRVFTLHHNPFSLQASTAAAPSQAFSSLASPAAPLPSRGLLPNTPAIGGALGSMSFLTSPPTNPSFMSSPAGTRPSYLHGNFTTNKLESPSTIADSLFGPTPSASTASLAPYHSNTQPHLQLFLPTPSTLFQRPAAFATPQDKRLRTLLHPSTSARLSASNGNVSASPPPGATDSPSKESMGIVSDSAQELANLRASPSVEDDLDRDLRSSGFLSSRGRSVTAERGPSSAAAFTILSCPASTANSATTTPQQPVDIPMTPHARSHHHHAQTVLHRVTSNLLAARGSPQVSPKDIDATPLSTHSRSALPPLPSAPSVPMRSLAPPLVPSPKANSFSHSSLLSFPLGSEIAAMAASVSSDVHDRPLSAGFVAPLTPMERKHARIDDVELTSAKKHKV